MEGLLGLALRAYVGEELERAKDFGTGIGCLKKKWDLVNDVIVYCRTHRGYWVL